LLLACHPPKETGAIANQAAARNRAILWILFETGMHATEICGLRLSDVDPEQGILRVRGRGGTVRWLTVGHEGRRHLLMYLEQYRLKMTCPSNRDDANEEPLFLTETGAPLTKGTIGLLFGRLRQRVGMSKTRASLLRKDFAARYLQAGGDQQTLLELLGQQKSLMITRSMEINAEIPWQNNDPSRDHRP
jgi:site-specific recombinase XerD